MVECDDFRLPPGGTSKEEEFDMLCHLELEPEKEEKKGGAEDEEEEVDEENMVDVPKYKSTVPKIQEFWLRTVPDQDDYIDVLVRCFASGLD